MAFKSLYLIFIAYIALAHPAMSEPEAAIFNLGRIPAFRNPVAGERYSNDQQSIYADPISIPSSQNTDGDIYNPCPQYRDDDGDGLAIYRRDPFSCNQFRMCSWGKQYIFKCPEGQLWDQRIRSCNFGEKVFCPYGAYKSRNLLRW